MEIAELRATYGDETIINAAAHIADERFLRQGAAMERPECSMRYFSQRLRPLEHEVFLVAFLDNRHRPIACEPMFRGTHNAAPVYPREVAKECLRRNASAVIVAHNHPSGDPEPSSADRNITHRLVQALEVLEIRLLDHIVVGDHECVSFAERGLI